MHLSIACQSQVGVSEILRAMHMQKEAELLLRLLYFKLLVRKGLPHYRQKRKLAFNKIQFTTVQGIAIMRNILFILLRPQNINKIIKLLVRMQMKIDVDSCPKLTNKRKEVSHRDPNANLSLLAKL